MKRSYSKYHAKKVVVDGKEFDSQKEATRWKELCLLQRAGVISDLQRQVSFELIPAQYEEIETTTKSGKKKTEKKLVERKTTYIADFVFNKDGKIVVEDTKGYKNGTSYAVFTIKRKLMYLKYGIKVREV